MAVLSNEGGHGFWMLVARICWLSAYGVTAFSALWFAFINFLGDEANHPLDFLSNKLRTRPYWYLLVLFGLGGLVSADIFSGEVEELQSTLPELMVSVNLEGFMLVGTMMLNESAAAGMVVMLLHIIISKGLVLIVSIPTLDFLPGAIYANMYFFLYMFFVFVLKTGAERHGHLLDKQEAGNNQNPAKKSKVKLPEGASTVPRLWARTILYGNPVLMILSDILFLAVYLMSRGEYGKALTICYSIVATLLLFGCCSQFRAGTTVE
eukprot:TRINITY_DN43177_c0_g1_i1.p1 TRINITY_DN43177_c0_g1~~TRINITY_DN43177_c0_g1_i1.p1  ORF type:complete len:265 (+),score=48.79 TRINITY_DN43177_c0_g1_i1:27-821(+)